MCPILTSLVVKENYWMKLVMDKISTTEWVAGGEQ